MHPVESIDHGAATVDGTEGELAIAGPGAPLVAEFCVADLALALGHVHRRRPHLPRRRDRAPLPPPQALGRRDHSGRVPVWKARRIAQATKPLCIDAAGVRRPPPGPPGAAGARSRRSTAPSPTRCDCSTRPRPRSAAARQPMPGTSTSTSSRSPSTAPCTSTPTSTWLMRSTSTTPSPPVPPSWAASGATESLDVRRSLAAGALARRELTLDLQTDQPRTGPRRRRGSGS